MIDPYNNQIARDYLKALHAVCDAEEKRITGELLEDDIWPLKRKAEEIFSRLKKEWRRWK